MSRRFDLELASICIAAPPRIGPWYPVCRREVDMYLWWRRWVQIQVQSWRARRRHNLSQIYRRNRPRRVGGVRWNKQAFSQKICQNCIGKKKVYQIFTNVHSNCFPQISDHLINSTKSFREFFWFCQNLAKFWQLLRIFCQNQQEVQQCLTKNWDDQREDYDDYDDYSRLANGAKECIV